jgi:RimJ/RimL family protein N-acetyltransferase
MAGHTGKVATWVAAQIPHVDDFGPCEGIAVMRDEYMVAGVIFHDYQPSCESIQLSMAAVSPIWARRKIIAGLLMYPFNQLGVYRVWTGTPISNTMALRVNEHIGFRREGVLNSMFGKGRHGVIMRLLKPDYDRLYARLANG